MSRVGGPEPADISQGSEVPDSQSNATRRKTRRARPASHHACVACKARKVRCDALRPMCSYCTARGIDCVYPVAFKRASCSQAHVTALERRLSELESRQGIPPGVASATNVQRNAALSPSGRLATAAIVLDDPRSSHSRQDEIEEAESPRRPLPRRQDHPFTQRDTPAYEPVQDQSTYRVGDLNTADPDQSLFHEHRLPNGAGHEHYDIARTYDLQAILNTDTITDRDEDNLDGPDDSERTEHIPLMDGMVEYQDASSEAPEGHVFYGNTSTLHFAMNVQASAVDKDGGVLARNATVSQGESMNTRRQSGAVPVRTITQPLTNQDVNFERVSFSSLYFQYLPRRHIANSLLERYFTAIHPIWPFLLEGPTRSRYEDAWSADRPESEIWSAQLNLIFALGFEFWEDDLTGGLPSRPAIEAGNDFYLRAKTFVLGNAFNMSSISMLQTLLLLVQYQQGTMQSEQCWLTIGHATRMAQGLGLHKPQKQNTSMSPLEEELRNRLWWGCFSLDRVSSMIYGRPTGIHNSNVARQQYKFPKAIDDQYISCGQHQPDDVPSLYAFFHCVAKLYCVVDEILEFLHGVNRAGGHDPECNLDRTDCRMDDCRYFKAPSIPIAILQLDNNLLSWHDSLPDFLQFSIDNTISDDGQSMVIQRQRNILRYRFLGIRILLHRQTILYLLQPPERRQWFQDSHQLSLSPAGPQKRPGEQRPRSPFELSFEKTSARICVSSAELLIEGISVGRPLNLAGAWWWDFYFSFNSLCVIFGAMSLQKADLAIAIPDTSRTMSLVERGFANIQAMVAIGGSKATQSEKFLKQLMAATIRGARKRSNMSTSGRKTKDGTSSNQAVDAAPVTCQPSPSASSPSQNRFNECGEGDPIDILQAMQNQTIDSADWLLDLNSLPSLWEKTGADYVSGSPTNSNSVEAILQSSFDLWDTLDSMPGLE